MTLVRDYNNIQDNYRNLLNKRLNAQISGNLEKRQKGGLFRVLDPAEIPVKPISPNLLKVLLLGLMAGLGMGVGLVFIREQMDTSFHNQEDLKKVTGYEVLAAIPTFKQDQKRPYTSNTAPTEKAYPAAGEKKP